MYRMLMQGQFIAAIWRKLGRWDPGDGSEKHLGASRSVSVGRDSTESRKVVKSPGLLPIDTNRPSHQGKDTKRHTHREVGSQSHGAPEGAGRATKSQPTWGPSRLSSRLVLEVHDECRADRQDQAQRHQALRTLSSRLGGCHGGSRSYCALGRVRRLRERPAKRRPYPLRADRHSPRLPGDLGHLQDERGFRGKLHLHRLSRHRAPLVQRDPAGSYRHQGLHPGESPGEPGRWGSGYSRSL